MTTPPGSRRTPCWGAQYGYQLLWVLLLSTIALVVFHNLGARMGVVTGQGLIGLVRQRFGVRAAAGALAALLVANVGTTCAEYAGVAAGMELFGVSRTISVPIAAVTVTALVLRGSFHRVEHILMALSAVFLTYLVAGFDADPDWGAVAHGLVVPTMPLDRDAVLIATATVGTTLAPWGLRFIQSYAVDKRLKVADLRWERVDVLVGAVLTGVIGLFIVIACAGTLHAQGISIVDAADAAKAQEPVAGHLSATLFGIGSVGAALLAASVLPLSTAYSVCEFTGSESALDDRFTDARTFYLGFIVVTGVGAAIVTLPGASLITLLVMTQVLNAVLLLPLLVFMLVVARDGELMGRYAAGRGASTLYVVTIVAIAGCVAALLLLSVLPT